MKTIMLTGFGPDASEAEISEALSGHFGEVHSVEIIRDGNPDRPLALVHMDLDDEAAFRLIQRLNEHWHNGRYLTARLMLHGD